MSETKRAVVLGLVSEFSGVRLEKLKDEARLFHDLGIHGDDVDELLEKIHKDFGTSSQGFEWALYFPNETEGFGHRFAARINPSIRKKRLTLGHLINVVDAGRWSDPDPDIRE